MLNKVMIIGRLGQNPEMRYMPSGDPVANFSVATSESYKDKDGVRQEKTEWHRIVVYGKFAESCNNYLRKGSLVYVEGSIQTRKWQDKQNVDHYTTQIRATSIQFLDRRTDVSAPNTEQQTQEDYGSPFPSESSSLDDMPF